MAIQLPDQIATIYLEIHSITLSLPIWAYIYLPICNYLLSTNLVLITFKPTHNY